NAAVAADDVPGLVDLATRERPHLVVVGPEQPLVLGLVDALEARGIRAFGPSRAAARLEGSKAFMKRFCERHAIPTAPFAVFDDPVAAERHARTVGARRPLVVKADGLAGGKGVVVATTVDESCVAIDQMMRKGVFGAAGQKVVLEECLDGEEASFHVICDGRRGVALLAAQDHKRVYDGDCGPNTGGMGAYAPAPLVGRDVEARVMREVVEPTLAGMAAEGAPFRGVLFVGLMIDRGTPRVLEFNVRFGDPEATVLAPMYDGWFGLLDAAARGDLAGATPRAAEGAAIAVVMASAGYPATPRSGAAIDGLDLPLPAGAFVRHAGTKRMPNGTVVTHGGRVLCVGARGATLEDAARVAYGVVDRIHWDGEHHRSDIGRRALRSPDTPPGAAAAASEGRMETKQTKGPS
ncbi:MAG: phosphoribosylamine--glycine ligase, partial [Myxococcota bacterium]|nr:phosphoribosylamine--glycine ligase [Myxococcota bacterium]